MKPETENLRELDEVCAKFVAIEMKTKLLILLGLLILAAGVLNIAIQYRKWKKLQAPHPLRWLGSPVYHDGANLMRHDQIEIGYRSDGVVIWRVQDTNTVAK